MLQFLPQILVLFFFLAIFEDCGYMARAAFLMDRLMSRVGLNGKSFIPLLSSFACAVPGIMAARVIEKRTRPAHHDPRRSAFDLLRASAGLRAADRRLRPARRYLGGLFNLQGLVLAGLYLLGVVLAVIIAVVLKRTMLQGADVVVDGDACLRVALAARRVVPRGRASLALWCEGPAR